MKKGDFEIKRTSNMFLFSLLCFLLSPFAIYFLNPNNKTSKSTKTKQKSIEVVIGSRTDCI